MTKEKLLHDLNDLKLRLTITNSSPEERLFLINLMKGKIQKWEELYGPITFTSDTGSSEGESKDDEAPEIAKVEKKDALDPNHYSNYITNINIDKFPSYIYTFFKENPQKARQQWESEKKRKEDKNNSIAGFLLPYKESSDARELRYIYEEEAGEIIKQQNKVLKALICLQDKFVASKAKSQKQMVLSVYNSFGKDCSYEFFFCLKALRQYLNANDAKLDYVGYLKDLEDKKVSYRRAEINADITYGLHLVTAIIDKCRMEIATPLLERFQITCGANAQVLFIDLVTILLQKLENRESAAKWAKEVKNVYQMYGDML